MGRCVKPIKAYRDSSGTLFFHSVPGANCFNLPCGQCVECRLERSRQWAARCMNEAQLHERNCFITLTYRNDPVSLNYRDFQLFMKRVRKMFGSVRFFMCGEYGENFSRPHFHAILFGIDFTDGRSYGRRFRRSAVLDSLWTHGFASVGSVTFESAGYVARYSMKKITGDLAEDHYRYVDPDTGVIIDRVPEFCHMSLKPGIGANWVSKYLSDVYPTGEMVVRGVLSKSPRYYDILYKRVHPDGFALMKYNRVLRSLDASALDKTDRRLAVKGVVTSARVKILKRNTFGS